MTATGPPGFLEGRAGPSPHAAAAPLLGELYERYAAALESFIARWGGFRGEDARDLTHDVFLKAGLALPRMLAQEAQGGWFDPQPWLYRIAQRVCIDRGRHTAVVPMERWDGPRGWGQIEHLHPRAGPEEEPEAVALAAAGVAEAGALVERARRGMAPRQGAVLALAVGLAAQGRFGDAEGYEAIAAALGMTRHGVKSLLWRAREHLRREGT